MVFYRDGGAQKTMTGLLGRVAGIYSDDVRAALLGMDEELEQLLQKLPQSPVCFVLYYGGYTLC